MSCVRFKFKSSLEYDKVTFEGLQISVLELREKIMTLKKLGIANNYTLEIIDPISGKGDHKSPPNAYTHTQTCSNIILFTIMTVKYMYSKIL